MAVYEGEKIKFFTDGFKTIKLKPGDEIPIGFHSGRTFNVNTWNKGLTAETDERVKANGQATRNTRIKNNNYNSWNKGISASEEQKRKQSLAMKGKPTWNKGLTKETNASFYFIS